MHIYHFSTLRWHMFLKLFPVWEKCPIILLSDFLTVDILAQQGGKASVESWYWFSSPGIFQITVILTLLMLEMESGVNTMHDDALAPKVTRASTGIILMIYNRQHVGLFRCESCLLLNKIQDMIPDVNTSFEIIKTIQHVKSQYTTPTIDTTQFACYNKVWGSWHLLVQFVVHV